MMSGATKIPQTICCTQGQKEIIWGLEAGQLQLQRSNAEDEKQIREEMEHDLNQLIIR